MRKTPMVRSGFLRTRNPNRPPKDAPELPEAFKAISDEANAHLFTADAAHKAFPVKPLVRGTYSGGTTGPIPKHVYIRSPALLKAVRTLPCMVTGVEGRTEASHSNWAEWGHKGRGVKADDNRIAALSSEVHREIDQGKELSGDERRALWWKAHTATVRELLRRGLWPADCPVPDIRQMQ